MTATIEIARLKVTLDHVTPIVMRRIDVPLGIRLDRLHEALQIAVGWTNSHLWELRARNVGWGIPDGAFGEGPRDAGKATLLELIGDTGVKTFSYLYDFGDGWEHTIRVERIGDAAPGTVYPRLVEALGCCPPEDIGGPSGYEEFLEAIGDPAHERHGELSEWHDAQFDPSTVDPDAIQRQFARLAKRWNRSKPLSQRKLA